LNDLALGALGIVGTEEAVVTGDDWRLDDGVRERGKQEGRGEKEGKKRLFLLVE